MTEAKIKKSERTRRFIIEKSAPIFNKKGYSGTSLQDLMEATGLTKGGIYGNFRNKHEIAAEAFEYNSRYILDQVKASVLTQKSAKAKLLAITAFYKNYIYQPHLSGGCPILNTAVEADDMHPELKEKVLKSLDYIHRSFVYIINEGMERDEFRSDIDPDKYATIFLSLIEGGIMQMKIYKKSKYLVNSLLHMEEIIEQMLIK